MRYPSVKFLFEIFCTKLTDLLREFLAVFVESKEFVFTFNMIEWQATHHPDLRQDVFVKDEYHFLNVPGIGTITVYDTFDCTFECLSNPSCLSLNLAASNRADGKIWCELLTSNKDISPDEFKENKTSHHFALKVRT